MCVCVCARPFSTYVLLLLHCMLSDNGNNKYDTGLCLCSLLSVNSCIIWANNKKFTCSHGSHSRESAVADSEKENIQPLFSTSHFSAIRTLWARSRQTLPLCLHANFTPFVTYILYDSHIGHCCLSHFISKLGSFFLSSVFKLSLRFRHASTKTLGAL